MQMLITDNAHNERVHSNALKIEHINLVSQLQVKKFAAGYLVAGSLLVPRPDSI